jgi:hypothetical protein
MEDACDFTLEEYGGDDAEFFHEQAVVARKRHKCYECEDDIAPGEKHIYVSGKWDGEWLSYRFCLACDQIAAEFFDGARLFGALWDGLRDNWGSGAPLQPCLNRVSSVAAKRKMTAQWKAFKEIP